MAEQWVILRWGPLALVWEGKRSLDVLTYMGLVSTEPIPGSRPYATAAIGPKTRDVAPDAIAALVALGYGKRAANATVKSLNTHRPLSDVVRDALTELSP